MMTPGCPCRRDCPDREAGCHATCERYAEWTEKRAKELEEIQRRRNAEQILLSPFMKRKTRYLKEKKKKGER